MEKEKQIAEMALDIHEYVCKAEQGSAIIFNSSVIGCHKLDMAKYLVKEKDYRKEIQGEWVKGKTNYRSHFCAKCGYPQPYIKIKAGYHLLDNVKYCPNCGCKIIYKGEK